MSPLVVDGFLRTLVYLRTERALPISLVVTTCQHALEGLPPTLSTASLHGLVIKEWELSPAKIIGECPRQIWTLEHESVSRCKMITMTMPCSCIFHVCVTTDNIFLQIFSCDYEEEAGVLQSLLLGGENLNRLHNSYTEFHGSVELFFCHIKMMLAHLFSHRGEYDVRAYNVANGSHENLSEMLCAWYH